MTAIIALSSLIFSEKALCGDFSFLVAVLAIEMQTKVFLLQLTDGIPSVQG